MDPKLWEAHLPDNWRKFGAPELEALFNDLKEKWDTDRKTVTTGDEALVVRQLRSAMEGINAHIEEEQARVQAIADLDEEPPAFVGTAEPAEPPATPPTAGDPPAEPPATPPEPSADGGEGGSGDGTPPAPPSGGDEGEEDDPEFIGQLEEHLAKAAALGYAVKIEGGKPVIEENGGGGTDTLTRTEFHTPKKGGIGEEMTQEEFDARFLDQLQEELVDGDTGGRNNIATILKFDPKAAALGQGAVDYNTALIVNTPEPYLEGMAGVEGYTVEPDPKLAAFCGPAETIYDIPDCVTDERKVRSLFRRIPARRGTIQFFRTLGLADVAGLDGIAEEWTDEDQDAIEEGNFATYKKCARIECQPVEETEICRIYSCVKVEVLMDYGSPEIVAMYMRLISAAHARACEEKLLCIIKEKSICMTWTGHYGSGPALAAGLIHLAGVSQFYGRLRGGNYMALVPEALLNKVDLIDTSATGDASDGMMLRERLAKAGIGLDTLIDACDPENSMPAAYITPPPAPGGDCVELAPADVYGPETFPVHLITPSDGFYFELPSINTGMVSSPELARQNCKQMFMETFEGLDKNGCSPWYYLEVTLCHNSDRAGFNTVFCG